MVSHPEGVLLTKDQRLLEQSCRPTDTFSYTLHARGMKARLGDEASPSVPLLDKHVRFLDNELDTLYKNAANPIKRREFALAGLANLVLWLGWLRTSEAFSATWEDWSVCEPENGPAQDLPVGCGLVSLTLSPETKSHRSRKADVIMSYRTMSGYCIGKWFHRARVACDALAPQTDDRLVFTLLDGTPWTSAYFRKTYLYPSLYRQQALGDKYLTPYTGGPGNSIEDKFWSLHCYRRGGRSHVSRGGHFGQHRFRKATKEQIYEHARWRLRRSNEAIDVIYREWTARDRIKITLWCH